MRVFVRVCPCVCREHVAIQGVLWGARDGATRTESHQRLAHERWCHFAGSSLPLPRDHPPVCACVCVHMPLPRPHRSAYHPGGSSTSWVVIGVLVAKSIGSTSKGAPYSRWRVSDLAGSDAQIALFGDAHKEHYSEVGYWARPFHTRVVVVVYLCVCVRGCVCCCSAAGWLCWLPMCCCRDRQAVCQASRRLRVAGRKV